MTSLFVGLILKFVSLMPGHLRWGMIQVSRKPLHRLGLTYSPLQTDSSAVILLDVETWNVAGKPERREGRVGDQAVGPLELVGQQVCMEHLPRVRAGWRGSGTEPPAFFLAQLRSPLPEAGTEPTHVALEKPPIAVLWIRLTRAPCRHTCSTPGPTKELMAVMKLKPQDLSSARTPSDVL